MLSYYFALGLCFSTAAALPGHVDPNVDRDPGSFQNPSHHVRPRFRYWIPDASIELSDIANDLDSVKRVGAGGMELLGYYYYGATQSSSLLTVPSDWTIYGWGTEAWRNLTLFTLQECKAKELLLDFAIGPNQGSGVPAEPESEGLMMDLVPFNISFPLHGAFSGQIPGWGAGKHVSSSIGLVVDSSPVNLSATPGFLGPVYYDGRNYTLDASSLLDVTSEVAQDGQLEIQMAERTSGLEYRLFSFYQKFSNYRAQASPTDLRQDQVPQSPVTTYMENGSWVPDHFTSTGAQVVIDFWEHNLLDDESRALFREVGNYGWEDSMEFGTGVAIWWTPNILQRFNETMGYDFTKYLPLLYTHVSSHPGPLPSPDIFPLNDAMGGMSYVNDYYKMLTIMNRDYLVALKGWLNASLDSKLSVQVVYNLPMEMAANVPAVDVPECESLGFAHNVDAYKQFSGPANLAGKRVISNELGAVQGAAYTQTVPELLWDVKLSIMGGVNEMILHGYPFSGHYANNSWPGYTTFYYRFSSMHGPRQPAWEYYDDFMNYTARMQYVAQSGVAKVDLALWNHDEVTYDIFTKYAPKDLQQYGFSYNYISPSNFDLEGAYVADKVLAPKQQAFKALVVRHNDTVTLAGVKTLKSWAFQGLPVVFSGGLPSDVSGHAEVQDLPMITAILEDMASLPNVHIVPATGLAEHLVSTVGVNPQTSVNSSRPWLTYWREDEESAMSYAILYNDAAGMKPGEARSTGSVTFATTGAPYTYDAWTGQKTPVLTFERTCDGITIPLILEGNQTAIIAFHRNESSRAYLESGSSELYTSFQSENSDGTEVVVCETKSAHPLVRSSGSSSSNISSTVLQNWNLTVESWKAPSHPEAFAQNYTSVKTNTTFQLQSLQPWTEISNSLRNVSGRGFYTSGFEWHAATAGDGAILNLGAIIHTARVWVNGQQVPPLDPTRPVADITDLLVVGHNSIEIVIATTLGGSIRAAWDEIQSGGNPANLVALVPDEQEYGLLYPVEVIPCRRSRITV